MGVDAAAHDAKARAAFERARTVLGYDLLALVRDGPEELLRETRYSQPAIFVTNLALFDACEPAVLVTAGHSFAEFCSLVVAGALSFEDALHVVDERAQAMQEAAERSVGGMSAILGLDAPRLATVVDRVRDMSGACVQMANFNSPTQIVISGDLDAVQAAGEALLEAGAARVVPLNVSGAWHSRLMEPAVARFSRAIDAAAFSMPAIDVVSNVDGEPYRDVARIKAHLVRSITGEVRWHDAALRVLSYAPDLIAEFGASGVLTPLMRRLPHAPRAQVVSDMAGVATLRARMSEEVRA